MKQFFLKCFLSISIVFLSSNVEAKCKFITDIGKKYLKIHENKYGPLSEDESEYAEFDILAPDICENYNFDDGFIVKHIFLEKKLMAIRIYANNIIDNSPTESMKLMNYAKRNYGDFDTGADPVNYNNYFIWERLKKYIVYKRIKVGDAWDEEIFISNDKLWDKLTRYYSLMEMGIEQDAN